ncbi:NAD-dependent epimerase/dehydratase family protein [Spongiactinospora sp. TRM90649]|uniref:NAD-dependent epimerase/dehydratase family protein n=1 Tax=Spongiactinospora sp. TRM90649 TaxID=3031114 RepID=UPI0023F9A177|nr:NAD-dependent epimerase/dehydratase family protein [Spongiactinospora sp. TRM90649]MDF5754141.1 NAD-dependent epimerase/dehydratase family protein [Spongiactinospora sp. TRM90649]
MSQHVVVGAGQVGTEVARRLAGLGHEVTVVSRSGSGPVLPNVRRVAADAGDRSALTSIATGADVIYNCVNPAYHRWMTDWPPIAASLLATAEATGAGYVILGNLYIYGMSNGPLTEATPLRPTSEKARVRIRMWEEALAAHRAGRIRATEVRGSDYFGPGALDQSHLGERFMPRLLAGKAPRHIGDVDQPHSWTYIPDVATALVTAGTDDRSWGRAWHIPTAGPQSYRRMAELTAEVAGVAMPGVSAYPAWVVDALGLVVPMLGEIKHVRYQFDRPFEMDSTGFQKTFGIAPTPLGEALSDTVAWWRERLASVAA